MTGPTGNVKEKLKSRDLGDIFSTYQLLSQLYMDL